MRVGGTLNAKLIRTCMETWGVEYPLLADVNKEKATLTCIKNHGVRNILLKSEVRSRCLIRLRDPDVRSRRRNSLKASAKDRFKKGRATLLARYGVDHNFKIDAVKRVRSLVWLQRYGVDNPFKSDLVKRKIARTNHLRYGGYPLQNALIRARIDWHASRRKAHETMKRRGTYGKSRVEDRMHDALSAKFGQHDVARQIIVNDRWPIDFYVKSLDVYVQLDGVYWHGLDRPIDEIRANSAPRDQQIVKKWETDRHQVAWFQEQGMRLVRVTDVELKSSMEKTLERINA